MDCCESVASFGVVQVKRLNSKRQEMTRKFRPKRRMLRTVTRFFSGSASFGELRLGCA
jgi:hypothetical protein